MPRVTALRCAVLSLFLVAAAVIVPTSASAAPVATVTASATATGPTSGSDSLASITVKITVAGSPAPASVLTAPIPGTVDPADVTVDGAPAPVGTASGTAGEGRTDVTVRLGTGATPVAGGLLAVGTHTVTVPTDLAGRAGTAIAPFATTLNYVDAVGGPVKAAASVTIPLPDLVVTRPAGTGAGVVLPLAKGNETLFVARIASRAPVAAADLTITVPRGLQLDTEFGVVRVPDVGEPAPLRCSAANGGTLTCPLGRVDRPQFVVVPLLANGTGAIGSTGTVTVSAFAANGLDATPADNSVRGTVRFVPPIRLRVDLTADHTTVEVGSKAHVTATVTNLGSYPAPEVLGIVLAGNRKPSKKAKKHFDVTGFTGKSADDVIGGDPGELVAARAPRAVRPTATLLARRVAERRQADKSGDDIDLQSWDVGTLAPHSTRRAVLTLKALSPGKGVVVALAASVQSPDSCFLEDDPTRCPEVDQVTLRAVASAGTNAAAADPIANTGVPTERWAAFALLLLVLGAAAQFAGGRAKSPNAR